MVCGREPYLAANLRSLPAEEFDHWVEYCNSPADSTTLAAMRAAAGFKDPFNVRYWGVGNESWGCGGTFTPQEYAVEYRPVTTDRKSTRLNSSHQINSYSLFCFEKKKNKFTSNRVLTNIQASR